MISAENIAGLVVGEGCFYAESAADPKYRSGWRVRPAFCIEMRADEREVLEKVRRQIGCGAIYELDFGRYQGYSDRNWHPHVKYRVSAVRDLAAHVVPFFRAHPLFGRKAIAFELFAEIVQLISERQHTTDPGLKRARDLASALSLHNSRGTGSIAAQGNG
jgi:hypothetical protein